jgi:putative component of membrane protein insertase Oxa1/YidC/SpoIIIJ protein YidD
MAPTCRTYVLFAINRHPVVSATCGGFQRLLFGPVPAWVARGRGSVDRISRARSGKQAPPWTCLAGGTRERGE